MASAKKAVEEKKMTGFICHDQYLEKTRRLSDQELGQLIRACMKYHSTGELVELSDRLSMAFDFIRDDIDCAEESYIKKCEQNKRNREKKPDAYEGNEPSAIQDDTDCTTFDDDREQPSTSVDNIIKEKEIKENIKKANKEKELKEKDAKFDQFWTAYPRHDSKENARKAFDKLNPDDSLMDTILQAIARQKESPQWQENGGQFIPYPASWLNGKRWQDEVKQQKPLGKPVPTQNYEQREYGGATDDARRRMLAMLDGDIDV